MENFRADVPGRGGKSAVAADGDSAARDTSPAAGIADAREGDVIRGLRSGLIFSLAIWAMLFTVGTLVF